MLSFFKEKKLKDIDQTGKAIAKLEEVSNVIPSADVLNFFSKLTDAYTEHQVTTRELAKIEAQKEILLTAIEKKYELYHEVFNRIFDERRSAIDKSFEVIDKGLRDGDRDLIGLGLQSLSKVVSSSPFANIQQLSNQLENNQIIEI